ncbi:MULTISPECIES: hypothetical protein [unclassified Rhizobium]|uniref:hypothetical protein n=1 Tax=unclassified Rhizobium TaxID=2613769 RepID=UPI001AE8E0FA|nr:MULTISPECIES: hypothetical protein [unclassified Rhizobium]MBP2463613.1 hypothetical protein [Rhizobium sp. PvP014]MBP2532135.1 hypothetical protein [Rhizobium sp. PvP099]
MFDRLSLKSVLLAGCCLVVPISYATGDNAVTSPLGTILPATAPAQTVAVMPPNMASVGTAAGLQQGAAPVTPASLGQAQIPTAAVVPAVASPQGPVTAVVPASFAVAAAPVAQPVAAKAGENPFAASTAPLQAPAAITHPTSFGSTSSGASQSAPAASALEDTLTIDETALRYYATQRDLKRLGAEIRRLKALYPNWDAPEDLFDPPTNVSEQPLWEMFGRGDYAGVHNEVARLQGDNPNWKPSADLQMKLGLAEIRTLMQRAFAQRNWSQVVELAESTPALMVCQDMNSIWLTAESLARTQDLTRAFELYKYVLTTCTNRNERLATVQKASLILPEAGFANLVAMGRSLPDGSLEFENVSLDPLRSRMGSLAQGNPAAGVVTTDQLQRLAILAQKTNSASDAALFGWYYYSQKSWEAAYQWFSFAHQVAADPKSLEGMILCMRNLDHEVEATVLAKKNVELTPEITKIYIELVADQMTDEKPAVMKSEDLKQFEQLVLEHESALGTQALGWYLLSQKNIADASRLFDKSVSFEPTEGGVVGQAVVAARTKRWATVSAIKKKYGDRYSGLADVNVYQAKYVPKKVRPVKKQPQTDMLTKLFGNYQKGEKGSKQYLEN